MNDKDSRDLTLSQAINILTHRLRCSLSAEDRKLYRFCYDILCAQQEREKGCEVCKDIACYNCSY